MIGNHLLLYLLQPTVSRQLSLQRIQAKEYHCQQPEGLSRQLPRDRGYNIPSNIVSRRGHRRGIPVVLSRRGKICQGLRCVPKRKVIIGGHDEVYLVGQMCLYVGLRIYKPGASRGTGVSDTWSEIADLGSRRFLHHIVTLEIYMDGVSLVRLVLTFQ